MDVRFCERRDHSREAPDARAKDLDQKVRALASAPGHVYFSLTEDLHGCRSARSRAVCWPSCDFCARSLCHFASCGSSHIASRHGTLSLYAALDTKTGRVHGKTTARHTSRDFVAFLEEVVSLCSSRQQIHIILDNLSAHKTQLVRASCNSIRVCSFTSPRPIPLGSTKSRSGSPGSNARSSPAAFSPRSRTWLANSVATSTPAPPTLARSSGSTLTPLPYAH